jgi:hypothetical protein
MWEFRFHECAFKHGISEEVFVQCFEDNRKLLRRSWSGSYQLIGSTPEGMILHIVYKRDHVQNVNFVFHGRLANAAERRRYQRRGK